MKIHFKPIAAVLLLLLALGNYGCSKPETSKEKPNIVVLFMDDVGYGDLSSYGHPTIRTPNIDGLARQGVRFTSFVTAMWCVPSRTQLMTGRYMPRVDLGGGTGADGTGGLPESELTLAEGLKAAGYNTGMAGKWHLGYKENKFLPTSQGFDSWLGLPYSNDFKKPYVQTEEPLVMYRDTTVVEYPVNQDSLTVKYTQEATQFIRRHSEDAQPFFFYLAYNMAHLPIHTTERFRGKSKAGLYGDVIETLDWSVGWVLKTLKEEGVAENTIVFLASDNGPWLNLPDRMLQEGNKPWHQGTTGLLRGYKHTSYEGGGRVPAMIRWPDQISPEQVTDQLVGMPDIYRTLMETGGGELPGHKLDGYNIMPFLSGEMEASPREEYAYFRKNNQLEALRVGEWKLRVVPLNSALVNMQDALDNMGFTPAEVEPRYLQLFNMQSDPGEQFNRAKDKPEIVGRLQQRMEEVAKETGGKVYEPKQKEKGTELK